MAFFPPISLFTAATAATHGVYKRENTKNVNALKGVKNSEILAALPSSTVRVLTTLSLAVNPVINDVDILQSPNPNGTNTGAIKLPISASILFDESVTTLNLISKVCKNHIITVATKITVNALVTKSFALSQISLATFFVPGIR